ncbi:MAG TPA: hypothetical protein PKH07_20090, partial [bacterium]|nr:hypothetical protein [bacterium]
KPVEAPSDFAATDNPISRLYQSARTDAERQYADRWDWLFVTKMWLADDMGTTEASKRERRISLVVQTHPQVRYVTESKSRLDRSEFGEP